MGREPASLHLTSYTNAINHCKNISEAAKKTRQPKKKKRTSQQLYKSQDQIRLTHISQLKRRGFPPKRLPMTFGGGGRWEEGTLGTQNGGIR